eukprot:Phypoly_transcript_18402.p1 GENE.Phypoly_transcript_18402~~Phypoly_transcript_18402.p1  ORF type:complete len:177 (+),score=27.30 Phypoly_transcript_18402:77-607(+)
MTILDALALPMRFAEALLGFVILGLMSFDVHVWHKYLAINASGEESFMLFCGLWGLLMAVALLIFKVIIRPSGREVEMGVAVADVISSIFYLAGWIALAAENNWSVLYNFNCGRLDGDFSKQPLNACRCTKASIALGAFAWVCWTISAVISVPPAIAASKGTGGGQSQAQQHDNPA